MKNATPFAFVFSSLLFANACQNKTQDNKADTQQAIKPVIEKVDTPDCAILTTMEASGSNSWRFITKDNFRIEDKSKPILQIRLYKLTPFKYNIETLKIVLDIDSAICADGNSKITITYADNSNSIFQNSADNNCEGHFRIPIDMLLNEHTLKLSVDPNLQRLRENKIHSISIEAHNGTMVYVLTDIQATQLQYLINCIHKAK